jgi:hypothetical protein
LMSSLTASATVPDFLILTGVGALILMASDMISFLNFFILDNN